MKFLFFDLFFAKIPTIFIFKPSFDKKIFLFVSINLIVDEPTVPKPAITILKEIQPLIEFCEQHADEDGMIHVS